MHGPLAGHPYRLFHLYAVGGKPSIAHIYCSSLSDWYPSVIGEVRLDIAHECHFECAICQRNLCEQPPALESSE